MTCPTCRADNPDGKKFCGECGATLPEAGKAETTQAEAVQAAVPVPGGEGAFFCAKHTKVVTRLRCGRCETPICPRCTVPTPAGMRCRACAKNKIAVRPAGLLHGAVGALGNAGGGVGRRVWYLALWYLILSFLRGPFE